MLLKQTQPSKLPSIKKTPNIANQIQHMHLPHPITPPSHPLQKGSSTTGPTTSPFVATTSPLIHATTTTTILVLLLRTRAVPLYMPDLTAPTAGYFNITAATAATAVTLATLVVPLTSIRIVARVAIGMYKCAVIVDARLTFILVLALPVEPGLAQGDGAAAVVAVASCAAHLRVARGVVGEFAVVAPSAHSSLRECFAHLLVGRCWLVGWRGGWHGDWRDDWLQGNLLSGWSLSRLGGSLSRLGRSLLSLSRLRLLDEGLRRMLMDARTVIVVAFPLGPVLTVVVEIL
jgi:hypothetical protein